MRNLHSLEYPAVYFPSIDVSYYFVDGENYSKEEWEKIRLNQDAEPLEGAEALDKVRILCASRLSDMNIGTYNRKPQ